MSSPLKNHLVLETISLEKATLYRLEGDIIKMEFLDDIEMDVHDMKNLQEPKYKLARGEKHYLLLNAPHFAQVSKEAREYSALPEANIGALAKAIVTNSLGMRLIANFFISVNKPPVPHRVFSNETDALMWIADLKTQNESKRRTSEAQR